MNLPRLVLFAFTFVSVSAFGEGVAPEDSQADEVSPSSRTLIENSYADILRTEFPVLLANEPHIEGDIDNDGFTDFATILSESRKSENADGHSTPTAGYLRTVLAICHGPFERTGAERSLQNQCVGIRSPFQYWSGKLLYTEWIESHWAPYAPDLGEDCNARGEKSVGTKLLMVDETYGHCTTLVFPDGPRKYHSCTYCAD